MKNEDYNRDLTSRILDLSNLGPQELFLFSQQETNFSHPERNHELLVFSLLLKTLRNPTK